MALQELVKRDLQFHFRSNSLELLPTAGESEVHRKQPTSDGAARPRRQPEKEQERIPKSQSEAGAVMTDCLAAPQHQPLERPNPRALHRVLRFQTALPAVRKPSHGI